MPARSKNKWNKNAFNNTEKTIIKANTILKSM